MLKAPKRIRGTYGKTWERLMDGMELDRKWLDKIGKILVEEIVQQARIDSAKARGLKAGNMIPRDPKFFQSFSHNIRGRSTIEIISTWPGITDLTEGRGPFPMEWLRRKVGEAKVIPLAVPGSPVPIFRSAPPPNGECVDSPWHRQTHLHPPGHQACPQAGCGGVCGGFATCLKRKLHVNARG